MFVFDIYIFGIDRGFLGLMGVLVFELVSDVCSLIVIDIFATPGG